MSTGTLYIVATPIGNLGDITERARKILAGAELVAAEDTRRTRRLLSALSISGRLISYREQNREKAGDRILAELTAGRSVALVTDAGTPGISDPGHYLVRLCVEAGVTVTPVPGPSALTAAVSASGLEMGRFLFQGFLPQKAGARREKVAQLLATGYPLVIYESPRRAAAALTDIAALAGDRRVVVAREISKLHEEFLRGTAASILADLEGGNIRGEVTIMVGGGRATVIDADLTGAVQTLREAGLPAARIASLLSGITGCDRREVYRLAAGRD